MWNVKTASASTPLLCRIMYFLSIFEYAYFQYSSCPLIFKDFTSLPILPRTYPILRPFNQLFFNEEGLPYFRRYHRSDVLHMAGRQASFFTELLFISQMFLKIATQQSGTGDDLYSIYQMMLKGHTYQTFKFTSGTLECREACLFDDRCQSYDVVMFIAMWELN